MYLNFTAFLEDKLELYLTKASVCNLSRQIFKFFNYSSLQHHNHPNEIWAASVFSFSRFVTNGSFNQENRHIYKLNTLSLLRISKKS